MRTGATGLDWPLSKSIDEGLDVFEGMPMFFEFVFSPKTMPFLVEIIDDTLDNVGEGVLVDVVGIGVCVGGFDVDWGLGMEVGLCVGIGVGMDVGGGLVSKSSTLISSEYDLPQDSVYLIIFKI